MQKRNLLLTYTHLPFFDISGTKLHVKTSTDFVKTEKSEVIFISFLLAIQIQLLFLRRNTALTLPSSYPVQIFPSLREVP